MTLGLLAVLMVGGCGSVSVANDLASRLTYEGYLGASVAMLTTDQGDVVRVSARGHNKLSDGDAIDALQTTVWNTVPRRFDRLDISIGLQQRQVSYQQLSQRFGPRDRALDERAMGADVAAIVTTISIVLGLLVIIGIGLAIMLSRRRKWEQEQQPAPRTLYQPNHPPHYPPTTG